MDATLPPRPQLIKPRQARSDACYWMELPTEENTLFALFPTNRMVPTTITRITANITAYSAMS
jgi:hypothetical protein